MTQVHLKQFPCFNNSARMEKLNELFKSDRPLMLHDVAIATGCGFDDSLEFLLLLYHLYLSDLFLVVYHNSHTAPADIFPLLQGFPKLPFRCSACDELVTDFNALTYGFMFKLRTRDIEFVS